MPHNGRKMSQNKQVSILPESERFPNPNLVEGYSISTSVKVSVELHQRITSLVIFLVFFLVYWSTTVNHFVGGDQAIFVTVAIDGGYAHAPGYPLYSMYLYATNWGDNPWLATSRATAVLGALAVCVLYRALCAWNVPPLVSIVATLIWALAPEVWFYHTHAEVFAGNNLAIATILWACAPGPSKHPAFHVLLLGLLAGLAISHHHTAVFLAPLGLWKTWTLIRDRLPNACLGMLGLAIGLLPYIWLPYVHLYHYDRWHWGAPATIEGFLHVFLRKDYGTFTMTVDQEIAYIPLKQWIFLASNSLKNLLGVVPVVAVAGTLWSWYTRRVPRAPLAALITSTILAGPFFVALMHREPTGINSLLVSKFHLMFFLLITLLASSGFGSLMSEHLKSWNRQKVLLVAFFSTITVAFQTDSSVDKLIRDQHPAPHSMLLDVTRSLGDDFVLVAYGDHLTMGTEAVLRQMGSGGTVIAGTLIHTEWYIERLRRKGLPAEPLRLVEVLHRENTPVFFTSLIPAEVVEHYPHYPVGLLVRVLPAAQHPPSMPAVLELNTALFESFETQKIDTEGGFWATEVAREYAQTWYLIRRSFDHDPVSARVAYEWQLKYQH